MVVETRRGASRSLALNRERRAVARLYMPNTAPINPR